MKSLPYITRSQQFCVFAHLFSLQLTVVASCVCLCWTSDLSYSAKSRALFPLWEELAEALKDREDVVVARIDASANDIDMSMQGSYPSLCLFPALYAERVYMKLFV